MEKYAGKLKTQLYWWLSKHRPFYINNEYKIELLYIDKEHLSAKLLITNLKTGEQQEHVPCEGCDGTCETQEAVEQDVMEASKKLG